MASSLVLPATPQRPLPGAFMNTPAPPIGSTIFAQQAASLRQNPHPQGSGPITQDVHQTTHSDTPVEKAAKAINDTIASEARFPDLESYITQGVSSDYDMTTSLAWQPFQALKMYDLPPKILEQANLSGMEMFMGVFPALSHAWIVLDNCLYLWDYTLPNPDLIGFEENDNRITAIKLVVPKKGVFVQEIEHLIVVSTDVEMLLLGVSMSKSSTGAKNLTLYNTRMTIPTRGLQVQLIEASSKSGRIFFSGTATDDIYEFQYQQEEGWFRGKTNRICHTRQGIEIMPESLKNIGSLFSNPPQVKRVIQIIVDDSRNLLYTLTATSELQVFSIREQLYSALKRPLGSLLQNFGHFTNRTDLLHSKDVSIRSISAIPAAEASKLSLVATTNTGCRLFLSATRGYGMQADGDNPPNGMQILHIRFPPEDPRNPDVPQQPAQSGAIPYGAVSTRNVSNNSRLLTDTQTANRFSPGYFLAFQADSSRKCKVFCSALDSARLKNPHDPSQLNTRFHEFGQWIQLPSTLQQVELVTKQFGATSTPLGFGNELAVQFDQTSTEIAIMTSTGVQTIRRRRLVDIFAGLMRYSSTDDEGHEGDIKKFVRLYGRGETAATALAVACGQGLDVSPDSRVTSVTDPDVIEGARKAFIDHGGKPEYNANAVDNNGSNNNVRPSPRHEGMALYISRLVRSIWKANIIKTEQKPGEGLKSKPAVDLEKLRGIQRDLKSLSEFLEKNKNFIEGLSGAQGLSRPQTRQEELALAGEHQHMTSLVQLTERIVEGISFVLVLFDEKIDEILALLSNESKKRATELTFEALFVSAAGRELAKELVKAIVNRNLAQGGNVDSVAEALRRRCGSFCSPDDAVIFKAQEQLKRASDAGSTTESGRVLLNESQRLFQKVAGSLSDEYLQEAVRNFVLMSFYAGAIQLCLLVAQEKDKAKRALSYLRDGFPEGDSRRESFEARKKCYDLIFQAIEMLDKDTGGAPDTLSGQYTLVAKRRNEAYDVINNSDDAVFLTCLYDWYISIGQADRLLEIDTPFVVEYLQRMSESERTHADLLWRYFAHHNNYLQAAAVQLNLARNDNTLSLVDRIGYLSRARTNASTRQSALTDSRQSKQQLLREISDLLEVANIQDDILQRMKSDPRLTEERRPVVLQNLDGPILDVGELFNQYADQAEYFDICLIIFQVADHRNAADIRGCWERLIETTHDRAIAEKNLPWEAVGEKIRDMGRRLNTSDSVFPVQYLLPAIERYYIGAQEHHPPTYMWPVDIFLDLDIPHETLLPVLEQVYYGNEPPFDTSSKRKMIANQMVSLLRSWVGASERKGERALCGSEENATLVMECLTSLVRSGELSTEARREAETMSQRLNGMGVR
ncbi:Non-repetitive/WGA-negative nucleoporin C-terminal-domain-containing protein [Acrodontium crateriforme]|uniref:Non-repetitive/WGA-negative nucleoporin C-terminal-domain-containing protein n=1 Tax=Acrodontium crateriforme TaxID=150365 RepID=A0AAQ3M0P7_9PEZI|nr:Non-repetitive/WGA-negative nucleoporin C-terminal-domain-containing protein [Acrodontium crateriforme]